MDDNQNRGDKPEMRDDNEQDQQTQPSAFGDRTDTDVTPTSNTQGWSAHAAADKAGMETDENPYSGGTGGLQEGQPGGGQYGEFGNAEDHTGMTTESSTIDPRTGHVKGGQRGASDVAGAAQYGGDAGSVTND